MNANSSMQGIISEESVSRALKYLAETDADLGAAKGMVKQLEHQIKVMKAQVFLKASGSVESRKAEAETDPEVSKLHQEYVDVVTEMEIIIAKRKTRELGIDVWRSTNANRRTGNI